MPIDNIRDTGSGVVTETMRALVQDRYGSTDTLTVSTVDTPTVAPDEVLIDVAAAYGITKPKSAVLGMDVSGRVVAVGADVRRFQIGDDVFGIANGAFAEFAAAKEKKLAHKPAGVPFEHAAAAAISGITALQALTEIGEVQAGQSVLVIGASGGVGSFAVQIAKTLGAAVTGVASSAKADLVRNLGADEVVDYAVDDYLDGTTRYDLIVDIGGLNSIKRLRRALKKTGTLVIVGGEGGGSVTGGIGRQLRAKVLSPFVSQRLTFFLSAEDYRHIEKLASLMEDGRVTPALGRQYRLDDVPQAIADLESGRAYGKSVIVVEDE